MFNPYSRFEKCLGMFMLASLVQLSRLTYNQDIACVFYSPRTDILKSQFSFFGVSGLLEDVNNKSIQTVATGNGGLT